MTVVSLGRNFLGISDISGDACDVLSLFQIQRLLSYDLIMSTVLVNGVSEGFKMRLSQLLLSRSHSCLTVAVVCSILIYRTYSPVNILISNL